MSKVLFLILLVAFVFVATAATEDTTITKFTTTVMPVNNFYHSIGSGSAADDSMSSGGAKRWGPYPLARSDKCPQADFFRAYIPISCVADGDTLALDYQLLQSFSLSDTLGTWTALDTITDAGSVSGLAVMDSIPAIAIVYRLNDIGGSASRLLKTVRILFRDNVNKLVR